MRNTLICMVLGLLALFPSLKGRGAGDADDAKAIRAGNVSMSRIATEASSGENWLVHGGNLSGDHFSPLKQINLENVGKLGLAWYADIPSPIGLVAEPLVVDGTVYLSAPLSVVYALDAVTGKQKWVFDPGVDVSVTGAASIASRFNRGVAVWKGAVIVGTGDCRLFSIDAESGAKNWEAPGCDPMNGAQLGGGSGITGAPVVADDKIFIGYLGSEAGARGSVAGFDAATGEQLWRFWTVPGDPEKGFESELMRKASKTWPTGWATMGGGGVWDAIHYDDTTGFLIFGTGSPMPRIREQGDTLFTNSVVAVDAATGAYKWHYQTVPQDAWDYDATMPKILADLEIDGKQRRVVFEVGKSGFFYVLDAKTGELLSADPIAKVTWASHVDMETGRPVMQAAGRYWEDQYAQSKDLTYPGGFGARNWEPMAYNPETGLIYMPVANLGARYCSYDDYTPCVGIDSVGFGPNESIPPGKGYLLAWDPIKRERVWSADQTLPYNGGVLATGGNLIFEGTGVGTLDAYNAINGQKLWSQKTGSSIQAAPVTYAVDGEQYVLAALGAGGGMRLIISRHAVTPEASGPARVMAFKLGGKAEMPAASGPSLRLPRPPELTASAEEIQKGAYNWAMFDCQTCHGAHAMALGKTERGGSIPDLRYMDSAKFSVWNEIVLNGAFAGQGMVAFGPRGMTQEQSESIKAYVLDRAWEAYRAQESNP